eukprot:TRINITY_DN15925_c0_g1_i2.p1 TRINITY_DN15925_c0_g1~~TRINITY_DN15925_c0_g1_i2.p1  ORF type:complete len:116 (-),score=18.24 TRINITY_DN15925_c0_g1_i2:355-702(-)
MWFQHLDPDEEGLRQRLGAAGIQDNEKWMHRLMKMSAAKIRDTFAGILLACDTICIEEAIAAALGQSEFTNTRAGRRSSTHATPPRYWRPVLGCRRQATYIRVQQPWQRVPVDRV